MSRWKKEEPKKNPSRDPIFDADEVASARECTGLLAAQIQSGEQGEQLARMQAIHPIHPPQKEEKENE